MKKLIIVIMIAAAFVFDNPAISYEISALDEFVFIEFTGAVTLIDPPYSGSINWETSIYGRIIYSDASITGIEDEYIALDSNDNFLLEFIIGPYTFYKMDDSAYGEGFPLVFYDTGILKGLYFVVENFDGEGTYLEVLEDYFMIYNDEQEERLIKGTITYAAIPIVSTLWLFLSGCAILSVLSRKRYA